MKGFGKAGACALFGLVSAMVFGCSSADASLDGEESLGSDSFELRCRPGAQRCADASTLETCNSRGDAWLRTTCANGCSNNACSAVPPNVATSLDGQMLLGNCLRPTGEIDVCVTNPANTACNPAGLPVTNPLSGYLMTDKTVTINGVAGQTYDITLHIQGVVEAKKYDGAVDANATLTSPNANGFASPGTPIAGNAYNVYMLRVGNPAKDYFLNSLVGPGVSDHTTYGVDYTATIRAKAGSTVRLVAADPNCSQIKNCGPTHIPGQCTAPVVKIPEASAVAKNPTFNFNVASQGQWLVMTVKSVTAVTP